MWNVVNTVYLYIDIAFNPLTHDSILCCDKTVTPTG